MGRFCTGVVVVTGLHDGRPIGFSAQSFVSLSLDPPLVAICPARSSTTWPLIRHSGTFGINILNADQHDLCANFARSGGDKFRDLAWRRGDSGVPMLPDVLGLVECRLEVEHEAGDHTIAVGRVLTLGGFSQPGAPLLFFCGRYGGFSDLDAVGAT